MSLEGTDPPQGRPSRRALNRGGGFPRLDLIPPQGHSPGGIPLFGFIWRFADNGKLYIFADNKKLYKWATPAQIPPNWFDGAYKMRVPIKINPGKISGTHNDFNMMIDSTISILINNTQLNGEDLRFADENKVEIPYDRDLFDKSIGSILAWLKFNASDEQQIYMYFKNPSAADGKNPASVWSLKDIILHFNTINPTGTSIVNAKTQTAIGTVNGTPTTLLDEKIGRALRLNGTDQSIDFPILNFTNIFTISFWVKGDGNGNAEFDRLFSTTANVFEIAIGQLTNRLQVFDGAWQDTTFDIGVGVWHYVTISHAATSFIVFFDELKTNPILDTVALNSIYKIGDTIGASNEFCNIDITDFQIQVGTAISESDHLENFNSQNKPDGVDGFYTLGSVEVIPEVPHDWFNLDWKKRLPIQVRVGQVPSGQPNFQMCIDFTSTDLIGQTKNQIRFAGIDKVQLEYEIEEFDTLTGKLVAWVNKPLLLVGDFTYVYFDNPVAGQENSKLVWINNNLAVWHLNQKDFSANSTKDSTVNANDGTPQNLILADQVLGKLNGSLDFNGSNTRIDLGVSSLDSLVNDYTISFWMKPNTFGPSREIISAATNGFEVIIANNNMIELGTNSSFYSITIPPISTTQFTHVMIVLKADNNADFYVNGAFVSTENGTVPLAGTGFKIGGQVTGSTHFDGIIDELRIYSTSLVANKVQTIFNNENSFATFFQLSSLEVIP